LFLLILGIDVADFFCPFPPIFCFPLFVPLELKVSKQLGDDSREPKKRASTDVLLLVTMQDISFSTLHPRCKLRWFFKK